MTITMDWGNRIINSDASIMDIVAFKNELRILEASAIGELYPPILSYKRVDIGGGAFEHFVDIINSYRLQFPLPGNYEMQGNINTDVVPTPDVFVERNKAVAFITGTGASTVTTMILDICTLEYEYVPDDVVECDVADEALLFHVDAPQLVATAQDVIAYEYQSAVYELEVACPC